jgi:hypothetical protein
MISGRTSAERMRVESASQDVLALVPAVGADADNTDTDRGHVMLVSRVDRRFHAVWYRDVVAAAATSQTPIRWPGWSDWRAPTDEHEQR